MAPGLWRAFAPSRRGLGRTLKGVQAVFDGLWLGALGPDDLAAIDARFYQSHGGDEPLFAADGHNTGGLNDWEAEVADEYLPAGSRVVVTAAGGGREVLALAERGLTAAGFEPNPALVQAGRALLERRHSGGRASLDPCPRDVFPPAAGPCDAVVVGWGSYIHIQGRDARVALLRQARARLPAGAPLLVSFWERPRGQERYFRVVRACARPLRALRRLPPPELGDTMRQSYVHWFTRAEVEGELAEAGFEVVRYRSEPYAHAVAVARG